jgi:transcriptional regulator with XRE-family HTH domain
MNQQKTGKYIAEKRKLKNMTQAQLADRLGVSDKAVSKWERGLSLPDISKYQELCEVLEVSLNEFFAGEDLREDRVVAQSEQNLMEVLRREASRKKQLLGTIAVVVLCVCVIVAAYVENLNLGEKENDNHLGKLKYDITKADENYTHYMDGEPMVGVTVDENETAHISKKVYFNMEHRTEITVMEAPYKNYEDAAANDALFRYRSSHDLSADQQGKGVNRITCGVLESGGAMAWIYTDCGTYIMRAETLMFDDEYCEEELHFFRIGVSVDETLEYETTDL